MSHPHPPLRFAPVPAPPHDAYSILLAGHLGATPAAGWRALRLERVDVAGPDRGLVLAPAQAAARWLSEPSGAFGGLRPPLNVAVTAHGGVLLLDPATGELASFDPCACRFARVPCIARAIEPIECAPAPGDVRVAPPRDRLLDPRGIAVRGDELHVADRGHHRIVRFAVGTWVPRGVLVMPRAQARALAAPWHPTGLAVDGRRRLIVSDPVNGRVDRFAPDGSWLDGVVLETGVTHVVVDCEDRILVVVEQEHVRLVPASASPVVIELDAGSEAYHWHAMRVGPLGTGVSAAIDVHVGDEPWTAALRDDPKNPHWSAWRALDAERTREPLPLGRAGRYLRVRLRPAAAHVPAPIDLGVRGARVLRIDGEQTEIVRQARADLVRGFGRPPLIVDPAGRLHLSCADGVGVFDARGRRVREREVVAERFERHGRHRSHAVDSRIEACQWHRVELRGALPPGCSVEVRTTTADVELTPEELDDLPESAWRCCAPARAMDELRDSLERAPAWDALVSSPPGRYLWLELVLRGGGADTPRVSSALLEYPRVSLRHHLPRVFGVDPAGADFTDRFTAIFDRTLRSIETHLDRLPLYFDPLTTPAREDGGRNFLAWLGGWIGVTLAREWPVARRRRYVKEAAKLYALRGTPDGLRRQLLLLLGFDRAYGERCLDERPKRRCAPSVGECAPPPACVAAEPPPLVLEHFKLRRWLHAGRGRLGADSVLWGKRIVGRSELSYGEHPPTGNAQLGVTVLDTVPDPLRDPFHVHAHRFSVFVPARVRADDAERRALEQLVARESPAHAQADVRYVEPRFRVGIQASIGFDAVIARMPRGVTVDATRLGRGSVLGGRWEGPHLEVGDTRLGATTRLT